MRLNEHAFHTWDIEVVFDDGARLPHDVAAVVVDNLELIARFAASRPVRTRTIAVATTEPAREFTVGLSTDSVEFAAGTVGPSPTWSCPPRRSAGWSTAGSTRSTRRDFTGDESALDTLRAVFPGF